MQNEFVKDLVSRYKTGFSLEQPFYTHEAVFAAEWECIFKKHWLYAGSTAQIKKPGDYFLYHLKNDSIIIIRGNDGAVHAHYNTCTHRGSAICLEDKGHMAKFICPYHQWVFDKDGTLLNARMMPDDFCKEPYNLHSVHVKLVQGLIFISLEKEPPHFDAIEKSLTPYIKPFAIDNAKVACIKNYTLTANWKLVGENFRECYHCGGAHPEYCSAVIGANLRENTDELIMAKQKVWEKNGLETTLVEVTEGTTTYAVRYPLRPGVESYSVDGKKISIPMGLHINHDAGVVGLVNYPNFWMDAVSDYVWTMRVTPVNAFTTDVEFCWLVDEKAEEGKDYDLNRLTQFWEITGDQDGKLCENNFRGIQSNAYRPGPYAPVEDQVVNFVDWCVRQLKQGII
ncbi:MAG TPA: aromatic ring-hydroxylating dioxygenase subunit alpha [Ferruginibacter sp.]|nr:aromatic ring-hydroxylating dioxygenase subunit alpha [Ferruginibacter sp.]HMP20010.1 aromatic ring-hydroxylating dioxygenase subunit alpha [Ferruginibacter sp.]